MKVGVLALQGDVREHMRALEGAGAAPAEVRTPEGLAAVDALVIPGGESTTIGKLLSRFALLDPVKQRAEAGMPLFGTCAGMILMATEVVGPDQAPHLIGVMDIAVRRNAYGRQVESFEAELEVRGMDEPVKGAFIRAPVVERTGDGVEVLAEWEGRPCLVRQGNLLAAAFHPEIAGEEKIHELFVRMAER
ncbi:MAG TPA: pyridoxal 5'-phosphate synthase glutaminase subunit PdxT [Actinomycetota bacterium]|nr:pyridoxal 5'-phosphate synthase glutaminase subunit PdxT [Actinomycetota bacterium]